MKILVCGGRNYSDYAKIKHTLDNIVINNNLSHTDITIIHGGARGADSLADKWAVNNYVEIKEFKADWNTYGKAAGYLRNRQMLVEGKPDMVIAFPGGKGTQNMIDIAELHGVSVIKVC